MNVVEVFPLSIADVKVVRFERFRDSRGYFTEPYRRSDVECNPGTDFLKGVEFPQTNESYSAAGVVRGLHFQWNPYMGKLVRTVSGRMVDFALDIRLSSPTFGKVVARDMPASLDSAWSEWIWVPPGFAHGNYFTEATIIEYFCTAEYSPGCEAGVSPLARDLDWSLVAPALRDEFDDLVARGAVLSDKDRAAGSLEDWQSDPRSANFQYSRPAEASS